MLRDWIDDVLQDLKDWREHSPDAIREAIEKHCPFKRGVAYVEVAPTANEHADRPTTDTPA